MEFDKELWVAEYLTFYVNDSTVKCEDHEN